MLRVSISISFAVFFVFLSLYEPETVHASPGPSEGRQVYIDTPNPCVKIERVEKNRVYLVTTEKVCIQVLGKVQVTLNQNGSGDADYERLYIFVDGVFWNEQKPQLFDMSGIQKRLAEIDVIAKSTEIPENTYKAKAEEEAQRTVEAYYSDEFQGRLREETERLKREVLNVPFERHYEATTIKEARLLPDERLYLFISSSIPVSTLRGYAEIMDRLEEPNLVMVMRGFKDGMKYMAPTVEFISEIIKKDPGCDLRKGCDTYSVEVQIDPLLFRRYDIKQVPALVYAEGVETLNPGSEGIRENTSVERYYVIYGDASLDYLIERIQEEAKSANLEGLIHSIRGGFYSTLK